MKSVTMLSQICAQICAQKLHEHLGNAYTRISQHACQMTALMLHPSALLKMSMQEIRLPFSTLQESILEAKALEYNQLLFEGKHVCHLEGKVKKWWSTENISVALKIGGLPIALAEQV